MVFRIDWQTSDDLDASTARFGNGFGHLDNIDFNNLQGGPPPWGNHSGDRTSGPDFEQVRFEAKRSDEQYRGFVHGFDVVGGTIVRVRAYRNGNLVYDQSFSVDDDDVLNFLISPFEGTDSQTVVQGQSTSMQSGGKGAGKKAA